MAHPPCIPKSNDPGGLGYEKKREKTYQNHINVCGGHMAQRQLNVLHVSRAIGSQKLITAIFTEEFDNMK